MSNWNPKYAGESTFKKKNHYDLKNGDVVARILPQPKGNNEDYESTWSEYHSVHFGYKNLAGKFRQFESPLVKKNKVVEVADPALDRINDLKDKLAKATLEGNAPLVAKLNVLVGMRGVYNVDNNHHFNVMLLDGSIGELKVRYKAKADLDREIKELRAKGVDPLSFSEGRFFVFSRVGTGNDTTYKVKVYKETINHPELGQVEKDVVSKVSQEALNRLESEGFNLSTLFMKPTVEEVAQIVAESDLLTGKSAACDRFFDARWKSQRDSSNEGNEQAPAPRTVIAPVVSAPVAAPTPAALAPAAHVAPIIVKTAPTQVPSQAQDIDGMSVEDFFKAIGVPSNQG